MLQLYNTLTRQKEQFKPISNNQVSLYVCGITPYDTTHVGHAFTYIAFDVLIRFLTFRGYSVIYTQNVTDINDRDNDILRKAREQNISWNKLAEFWTNRFLSDMKALNWIAPTHYLKASQQIPAIIELIKKIMDKGYGYEKHGSVFLDITKKKDFGKLSRYTQAQMLEKAKSFEEDLTNPNKRHPLDITLWRASSPDQPAHIPSFPSPWGKGRPGWHIECSAMSIASLGQQIDIHGGGVDLIYPHHESEIAQSEAATGKMPFVKYWMHTGTMRIDGAKMSKSLGNLILVNDLLKKYSANAIRWVLLSHHYRQPWEYDENEYIQAEQAIHYIKKSLDSASTLDNGEYKEKAIKLLEDDLKVPEVLTLTINDAKNQTAPRARKEIVEMLGFKL